MGRGEGRRESFIFPARIHYFPLYVIRRTIRSPTIRSNKALFRNWFRQSTAAILHCLRNSFWVLKFWFGNRGLASLIIFGVRWNRRRYTSVLNVQWNSNNLRECIEGIAIKNEVYEMDRQMEFQIMSDLTVHNMFNIYQNNLSRIVY